MKSLLRNAFFRADVSIDGMFSPKLSPASPSTMLRRNFGICLWSLGASADLKFKKWILKPMALTGARRIAGRVASALVLIVCATSNAAWGQSLDELYAKARNEKTLELYTGGPVAPFEAAAKEFEQRYPGIHITITGGFSNVLDRKIDAQLAAKELKVDLAMFQTLQDFVRWKKAGVLLNFKPAGFDEIDTSFKDEDGAYIAVQINAQPYVYNPNLVRAEDAPRTALDFLQPRFKDKLVAAYPSDDDVTLYTFYSVIKKYGWNYMDQYMANQPTFIQGHLGVLRSIAKGDNLVTFDSVISIALTLKMQGEPQAIAISDVDPLPIWPFVAGIFKSAPHPNAAKLFLTWYLGVDQQSRIGTWSPRADVPPPSGLRPVLSYKVDNSYREFITNGPLLTKLRKRFEQYTGPVKNTGGVR
ncbi:extracellular solute-binding protein [Bradyrhizobium sp. KBS0727]|uniref:extracellular solute-binding protein n=1 Tax=unclassified Bradyrhizobium TaxID=2631580 RepID=UPI00110F19CB|nr:MULTISPECIES: extracellular solute-binding protein [unclassified Bradyrhizobium]QDW40529.1 extracellular solute-binding protein [Bradyrhizobium sp. KBS0725]QDW47134.1 extracellular solute-binding protein [Bradyrhizobium sp. KBS0727]